MRIHRRGRLTGRGPLLMHLHLVVVVVIVEVVEAVEEAEVNNSRGQGLQRLLSLMCRLAASERASPDAASLAACLPEVYFPSCSIVPPARGSSGSVAEGCTRSYLAYN